MSERNDNLLIITPSCNYIHKCIGKQQQQQQPKRRSTTIRMIQPPPSFNLPQPPNPISYLNNNPTSMNNLLNDKFLIHYLNVNNSDNQLDKCNYFKIHQFKSSKNLLTGSSNSSSILPKLVSTTSTSTIATINNNNRNNIIKDQILHSSTSNESYFQHNFYISIY